jgi:hypothetical protein
MWVIFKAAELNAVSGDHMYMPSNAVDEVGAFRKIVLGGMLRQRKLQKLCENCINGFLG